MAPDPPSNGTLSDGTSTPPTCALPPSNGTQQWHPIRWHVQSANVCTHHPKQWHPAMAPSNGTLLWHLTTWHLAMASYQMARPLRQHVRSPPLLLEVRTPIAKAIWGKNAFGTTADYKPGSPTIRTNKPPYYSWRTVYPKASTDLPCLKNPRKQRDNAKMCGAQVFCTHSLTQSSVRLSTRRAKRL